uniref:thioredoxin-dependent peroxiredoxin n=1 Tax=Oncorhynchus tshawytscha TaxID=74940 RepID=A0A8C8F3T6_ONCTS
MFNTSFISTKLLSEVHVSCAVQVFLPLLCRINTERKDQGLGPMKISPDYGVLKEDEGIAYRGLFVIDDKGIPRQIPINDLPVGCSVDETLHLVQAFQHTDKFGEDERRRGQRTRRDTIVPNVQKSKEFFSKQN